MKRLWPLLFLLAIAGCGGLPLGHGATAVRSVSPVGGDQDVQSVRRIPPGPEPGASASSVVSDFLAAGADSTVAQEFLTPGNRWDPGGETTVFGDVTVAPVKMTGPDSATATAVVDEELTIAADGSTTPGRGNTPVLFTLLRQHGTWQISVLQTGTMLPDSDLPSSFRRAQVAWLTGDKRGLVLQSVLLPGGPDDVLPDVVDELLAGPGQALAAAGVQSALPAGTFKRYRAVQTGDEVDVSLQGPTTPLPASIIPAARAEFAATLLALPGVNSVRVDLAGQPLLGTVANGFLPITKGDEADFDRDAPSALPALVAGPKGVTQLKDAGTVAGAAGVSLFAVSADSQRVAALRREGSGFLPVTVPAAAGTLAVAQQVASPGNWTSIAWGDGDDLWLTRDGNVYLASDGRPAVQVKGSFPPLSDLLIAPDGVHVVGVTTAGALVTGLLDSSGPTLSAFQPAAPLLQDISSVAVVGDGIAGLQVAVVATMNDDAGQPTAPAVYETDLGAPDTSLDDNPTKLAPACPSGTLQLSATPGKPLLASCHDGSVRQYASAAWTQVAVGLAAYPQG